MKIHLNGPTFLFVISLTFFESWILSSYRFSVPVLEVIYKYLNFPFGYLYIKVEHIYSPGTALYERFGDDIVQAILWVAFTFIQGVLFFWIYKKSPQILRAFHI